MVTRALEQLGAFMGANLSHNAESELIVALNDWLLWQGSAAWDRPEAFEDVLATPEVRRMATDYLQLVLDSPRAVEFTGRRRLTRGQTALRLDAPWGFKDPRATFTLPLWLELWPDAKVVSMTRHGVDVASSLQVRAAKVLPAAEERYRHKRRGYLLAPPHVRRKRFVGTLRCARLDGGFELWDAYATAADRHVAALGDRALHLRYEDFLADPRAGIADLARFCGLPAGESDLDRIADGVNAGRAYAFAADPELRAFAERDAVADALLRHGYEPRSAARFPAAAPA
jgi:hypothetical protein